MRRYLLRGVSNSLQGEGVRQPFEVVGQKDIGFGEIVGEPLFKNLANDPRFKALLRKVNLPE